MIARRVIEVSVLATLITACAGSAEQGETLADLRAARVEIKEERIDGGIEKAIQSYRRFLEETPESRLTPEALRRLADLKIQKEYGTNEGVGEGKTKSGAGREKIDKPSTFDAAAAKVPAAKPTPPVGAPRVEADAAFEKRASGSTKIAATRKPPLAVPDGAAADLQNANAQEAIELYKKLLKKYPHYERNDQVLYNMSRAYEELGLTEEAMTVMTRIVKEYPRSRFLDEVQFRRGEYFFARKKYLDAEDAYKSIVALGAASTYYEIALYKLGWSFYKQELYDEALERFMGVLNYRVTTGYDFDKGGSDIERKRIDDTFRVISLAFSNTGGAATVTAYFAKHGKRPYEMNVYANLGEHYLEKRRYADAATSYQTFVKLNPLHKAAPDFDMRVIEIYKRGAFPKLVIDASKAFATNYGLKSEYWKHFDIKSQPNVIAHLKTNLRELANYYHSLYQNKAFAKTRDENLRDAQWWYRQFLESFPRDPESPAINYQLAELLLEHKSFEAAAAEYERTAYTYASHDKAAAAGYAAVFAHREHVKLAAPANRDRSRREAVRSSLKFVDTFPKHEKAVLVLGATADDLYEMKDYVPALAAAQRLIAQYPSSEQSLRRSAWIVAAHASFDLQKYPDAEAGYNQVLKLTGKDEKNSEAITDNLAASIYKQGEQAAQAQDHKTAVQHFLRVGQAAPQSKIRPTAEFDAASVLIKMKDWDKAIEVLQAFRKNYPTHELQPEGTKKIAFAYREAGKLAVAAAEYERIDKESKDPEVRRGALLVAAELYEQAQESGRALDVYRRYVAAFPKPLELALESRHKIAAIYKTRNDTAAYAAELRQIMDADLNAGRERSDRTRFLGANAALGLAEPLYDQLVAIKLVKPFNKNLAKKKTAMKAATDGFSKLVNYQVGDTTAAATYYLAEIYYHFNRALTESERPDNLNRLELEQYELALEEQAFPFEEKAIVTHQKNIELLSVGVGSVWIEKSIEKLGKLMPARYGKPEERTGYIGSIGPFELNFLAHRTQP